MSIISGRRIIPVETQEPPAEADTATILYHQIQNLCEKITKDKSIYANEAVPVKHVFFKERIFAFCLFFIACCYKNIDLGTEITDKHRSKLSETKIQSQVETYMTDFIRSYQTFKIADAKARKKHRFDNTAALNEMIPILLAELNADKTRQAALSIREHIFDFLDVLNNHHI